MCKSNFLTLLLVGSATLPCALVLATTNQVWVTDEPLGAISTYIESNNALSLNPKKVEAAQKTLECLPASMDPAGNWGAVTGGLQMSIRLEKTDFATNEAISAILLIRNMTNQDVSFTVIPPKYFDIEVTRNGEVLKPKEPPKNPNPFLEALNRRISNVQVYHVFPYTQKKEVIPISEWYDISVPGEYSLMAKKRVPSSNSPTEVSSGTAHFRVDTRTNSVVPSDR